MRTLGVEEELLLVDARTGMPSAVASQVLRIQRRLAQASGTLEAELQQQQVEVDTAPTDSLRDLAEQIRDGRRRADDLARLEGARAVALATSPVEVVPRTTPKPRYTAMAEHLALTSVEQLTCGCHVHVAVDSDDEGVAVLDRIRVWLPALLALSANSPYWQGRDTGYASYRYQAWQRFPTAGPLDTLGSGAAYHARVGALLASGVPLDEGMIYFDARLSRNYPTVEIRIADVCLRADDTTLIAALVRGLVERAARDAADGIPAPDVPADLLRMAGWQASRHGLATSLLDPGSGRPAPALEVIDALRAHVGPVLTESGDADLVDDLLARLLHFGSGHVTQREVAAGGRLTEMILTAAELTLG